VLDGLGSLLDKSLVRSHQHGLASRYGMFETVREFALDQLDRAGECEATLERHAAYFLTIAERGPSTLEGFTRNLWRGLLETEHPNLQQALATMAAREDDAGHLRLTMALTGGWFVRSHAAEGLPHLERVLARESGKTLTRAQALHNAGNLAYACGAYAKAERWLQEGEELARAFGETTLLAQCHLLRGAVAEHLGDEASAQSFFEAGLALAQESGAVWLIGLLLANLSDAAYRRGDIDLAERFAREGASTLATSGDAFTQSMNFGNIAQVALARGAIRDAAEAFKEALRIAEEIESRWNVANAVAGAAAVSAALGIPVQAARLLGAADMERERSGHPRLPHFGLFTQTQAAVQRTLDDEAYQASWDAGRSLSTEEAVTKAQAVFAEARRGA
jgi:tetratricopeptide (TPR) repeat protein